MNISKKELQEKDLIHSIREHSELYNLKNRINSVKLDAPIKHGYVRSLVFHEDAIKRKDFSKLKDVVEFLGIHKVYSMDVNFLTKNKTEKHAHVKPIRDPRYSWYPSELARNKTEEFIKKYEKYLTPCTAIYSCPCSNHNDNLIIPNKFIPHYRFIYPWLLKEITNTHYLTHYTPVDGELESQIKKLENHIIRNNYWEKAYSRERWESSTDKLKRDKFFPDDKKETREALQQNVKVWEHE